MLGREDFLQNRAQLDLAQNAARFHIGQHFFQIADAYRQRLHFAKPFVYLFQPFVYQPERLGHFVLQRFLQLFIHRLADAVQSLVVVLLHILQALRHGLAHRIQLLLVGGFKGLKPRFQLFHHRQYRLVHGLLLFGNAAVNIADFQHLHIVAAALVAGQRIAEHFDGLLQGVRLFLARQPLLIGDHVLYLSQQRIV